MFPVGVQTGRSIRPGSYLPDNDYRPEPMLGRKEDLHLRQHDYHNHDRKADNYLASGRTRNLYLGFWYRRRLPCHSV